MKNWLALLILLFEMPFAAKGDTVVPWKVSVELSKFTHNQQQLPYDYLTSFPDLVHNLILSSEKAFFNQNLTNCKTTFDVKFIKRLTNINNPVVAEFENGIVRIETSKCFEFTTPKDLIRISGEVEFKRKAFSTLKNITQEESKFCEETAAPTLGKSSYCYEVYDLLSDDLAGKQINFVVENDPSPRFEAPVFFREGLVSAKKIDDRNTAYYVVSYVRGPKMNAFQKLFGKDYMQKVQLKVFEELEKELGRR